MSDSKKYMLVIKRNNNDYYPIEAELTNIYEGENLFTIEGIDSFTRKVTKLDLISELLRLNIVDISDKFNSFAIIYYEKGRTRELKEGVIFKDDFYIATEEEFFHFMLENVNNKPILSQIYNICNFKNADIKVQEFAFFIKNIDIFKSRGKNAIIVALSSFFEISYEQRRRILIKASERISLKAFLNQEGKILTKNDSYNQESKVA